MGSTGQLEAPNKFIQSLDIVIKRQLKQNHDDTLIEQLMTLVQNVTESSQLHVTSFHDHLKSLSYDPYQMDPCILRVLAFVLNNSQCPNGPLVNSFYFLAGTVSSTSSLSWQSSFLHSLQYFLKGKCLPFLASLLGFFPICCDLRNNSSSYIIKSHSEKVILAYFKALKSEKYEKEDEFVSINDSLFGKIDSHLLDFLRENLDEIPDLILKELKSRIQNLLDEIADGKPADEAFLCSLACICGRTSESEKDLRTHLNYWLKRSNLLATISLVVSFEECRPGQSGRLRFFWLIYPILFQYGLTHLASEFKSLFNLEFEKHWIEQRVNSKIGLHCINSAKKMLLFTENDEEKLILALIEQLVTSLVAKDCVSSIERKSCVAIFDFLLHMCKLNENVNEKTCDISRKVSHLIINHQCLISEYFQFLHQLITKCVCIEHHSLCYLNIIISMLKMSRFNQPLVTWQDELEGSFTKLTFGTESSELNVNLTEYLIECVTCIYVKYYPLKMQHDCRGTSINDVSESLVETFANLWTLHKSNVSFISITMPLLVTLNFTLSRAEKVKIAFGDEIDDKMGQSYDNDVTSDDDDDDEGSICRLFLGYFSRENLICSIVNTFETIPSDVFVRFHTWAPLLYKSFSLKVIPKLVEVCVTSVDDELKVKSLECVDKLLSPIEEVSHTEKFILLYKVGFVHALYSFITGPYDGTKIRQVTLTSVVELRQKMKEIDFDCVKCSVTSLPGASDASGAGGSEPLNHQERIDKEGEREREKEEKELAVNGNSKHCEYTSEFKRSVIEEMFKDFDSIPTQDILCELSARANTANSLTVTQVSPPVGLEKLLNFFSSFDPAAVPCEPLQVPPQGILDDIINAKSSFNCTIPDCY